MKICVLGLGYIGLPTSLLLAGCGNDVVGVDLDSDVVEKLNNGVLPFDEPGLISVFNKAQNNFTAKGVVESSDVYIIAVPTPLNSNLKKADLSFIKKASEDIKFKGS